MKPRHLSRRKHKCAYNYDVTDHHQYRIGIMTQCGSGYLKRLCFLLVFLRFDVCHDLDFIVILNAFSRLLSTISYLTVKNAVLFPSSFSSLASIPFFISQTQGVKTPNYSSDDPINACKLSTHHVTIQHLPSCNFDRQSANSDNSTTNILSPLNRCIHSHAVLCCSFLFYEYR